MTPISLSIVVYVSQILSRISHIDQLMHIICQKIVVLLEVFLFIYFLGVMNALIFDEFKFMK